eukprot:5146659-Pyramimonas_sp.AAC.2
MTNTYVNCYDRDGQAPHLEVVGGFERERRGLKCTDFVFILATCILKTGKPKANRAQCSHSMPLS